MYVSQQFDVTSVGVNPTEDRAHRMKMYLTAMIIRVACVVSLFWVQGWWVLLVGLGAVILPYVAVLLGNAVANTNGVQTEKPSPLALQPGGSPAAEDESDVQTKYTSGTSAASKQTIIFDATPPKSTSHNETSPDSQSDT